MKRQFLITIEPSRADLAATMGLEEQRVTGEHFEYLKHLHGKGVVLFAGRTTDEKNLRGLIVVVVADKAAARALLEADPAVQAGIFRGRIEEFMVVLK
jgi:uncharacterized protein YciI